jgi:hypothetical protein
LFAARQAACWLRILSLFLAYRSRQYCGFAARQAALVRLISSLFSRLRAASRFFSLVFFGFAAWLFRRLSLTSSRFTAFHLADRARPHSKQWPERTLRSAMWPCLHLTPGADCCLWGVALLFRPPSVSGLDVRASGPNAFPHFLRFHLEGRGDRPPGLVPISANSIVNESLRFHRHFATALICPSRSTANRHKIVSRGIY